MRNNKAGWFLPLLAVTGLVLGCQNPMQLAQAQGAASQERAINSNNPSKPFPQAQSFAGTIKPNHRTQAQLNQDVLDFFNYWQNKYVKASNGNTPGGGYYIEADSTGGHDYPIKSNSEAHGYGMIIYALMADKQKFDGMYNMYNQHRSTGNNHLMSWVITQDEYPSQDGGSATDGDMDIAYSLLLADKQWGSGGAVNYLAEAQRIISSGLKASDFSTSSYRTLLGDWSTDQYATRSSDWMAGHMRAYGQATGDSFWNTAASTVYSLIGSITSGYSSQTGLMPDFIVNSTPRPASPNFLEGPNDGSYYYNACRFPWRIATDFAHNGTAQAKTALDKINAWLKTSTGNNPASIKSGYSLSGNLLSGSDYFSGAFAAPFVAGMIVNSANQQYLNQGWDTIRNNKESYYEDNVTLMCMLLISGNWWNPNSSTPGDTQAPTVPGNFRSTGVTNNSVSLAWNASTDNVGVAGYRISYGSTTVNVTGTSQTVSGLSASTAYTFSIQAYDAAGNFSGSATVNATTSGGGTDTQAPTVPGNFRVTGTSTSTVSLAWNASTDNVGVTGYKITYGQSGSWSWSINVTGTSTTVTSLPANVNLYFNIQAYDAAGNLSAAATVNATTSNGGGDTQAPTVPGNFRSTGVTASSVSLAWNASTDNVGVTGYRIGYGSTTVNITGTSFTVSGLNASTAYSFSIRAYDAAGNLSAAATVNASTSGGGGYPAWNSGTIYYQGDMVSHAGKNWRAQWWTQGEVPGTTGEWGVWREI